MKRSEQFPFDRARRITSKEVESARKAIEKVTGRPRARRRGRPPKHVDEKYIALSIRLHPLVYGWIKKEAKRLGLPYQTLINQLLLRHAA